MPLVASSSLPSAWRKVVGEARLLIMWNRTSTPTRPFHLPWLGRRRLTIKSLKTWLRMANNSRGMLWATTKCAVTPSTLCQNPPPCLMRQLRKTASIASIWWMWLIPTLTNCQPTRRTTIGMPSRLSMRPTMNTRPPHSASRCSLARNWSWTPQIVIKCRLLTMKRVVNTPWILQAMIHISLPRLLPPTLRRRCAW